MAADPSIEDVIRSLGSRDKRIAEEAVSALARRPVESMPALVALVDEGRRLARRQILLALPFPVASLLIATVLPNHVDSAQAMWLAGAGVGAILAFVGVLAAAPVRAHGRAASAIAMMDDPRVVPVLLDCHPMLKDGQAGASPRVMQSLIRLLPRLQPADRQLFEPRHLASLRSVLNAQSFMGMVTDKGEELNLAVLKAFEQVGGPEDLPAVERLARITKKPSLREAALECAGYLRERVSAGGDTLLRPAGAETATLLRPAGAAPTEDTNLLRATDAEGDSPAGW